MRILIHDGGGRRINEYNSEVVPRIGEKFRDWNGVLLEVQDVLYVQDRLNREYVEAELITRVVDC